MSGVVGKEEEATPPRSTASGTDSISALPDGVRLLVLFFLPAHEAVQTAVLARSWRDLWRRTPVLRITAPGSPDIDKFNQFVERLLQLHLSAAPGPEPPWCHLFGSVEFMLSDESQGSDEVEDMITNHEVSDEGEDGDMITDHEVSDEEVEDEDCPLPHFRLYCTGGSEDEGQKECTFFSDDVQAPFLKHLTLARCYFFRFRICLPGLASLSLTECQGRFPFFASMPLFRLILVAARTDAVCLASMDVTRRAVRVVVVFLRDLKFAHTFRKLKTLVLDDWFLAADLSALVWFLRHSPIHEKLTLTISMVHQNTIITEGKWTALPVASRHLKMVEIKGHKVHGICNEILKILAASGVLLEQINIQRSSTVSGCQTSHSLQRRLHIARTNMSAE